MGMAIVLSAVGYLGGAAATIFLGDQLSKRFAKPGVAGEGLPGREYDDDISITAPAGPPDDALQLLVVFGASGGTGLAVLEVALDKGYFVRAFVRNNEKLYQEFPNFVARQDRLDIVVGNLTDTDAVT